MHGGFEIRIVGDERYDSASILSRLRGLGLVFEIQGRYSDPITEAANPIEIEHVFEIDVTLQRAASKICFNYATSILGAELMYQTAFDPIRRFIRYAELMSEHPVTAARVPLLRGDAQEIARVRGHLCSVGWRPESGQLVSNLSLFNDLVYEVVLCSQPLTAAVPHFTGHLFDLASRRIEELPEAFIEPPNAEPPNSRTI